MGVSEWLGGRLARRRSSAGASSTLSGATGRISFAEGPPHQSPSWPFPILQAHQTRTGRGLKRRDHGKQLAYLGRDRSAIFNANATQGPRKAAPRLIALSALVSRAKLLRVNSSSARGSPRTSVKCSAVVLNATATHGTVL
ncbi:hypothetical protein HPB50_021090 [Hyalomma asiaticum]|uniref:Uncharacterized protein n=1 Tax=Hyalomma asiaticum TaxID=266040 RepID=A0ACB7TJK5_HYAAI|nr:hypothetical protein HPB50_021090 [Hyalomma asiaticum]